MINKFKRILKIKNILIFLLGFGIMLGVELYFLNSELIIGNLGKTFYYTEISLVTVNSILFGSFLALSFYKIQYFSAKKSFLGFIGGFFGFAVSGCPACSITIASYIGLAGIISAFPYSGLELKVAALFLLLYANYSTFRNLEVCGLKK